LNQVIEKNVDMVTNHRYVYPTHLRALLGVGNFAKLDRVCADRL
jgi:hypothetical protein